MAAAVDARALALSLKRLRQERDATVLQASLQRIAESCVELFGLSGSGLMLADEHGELRYVASTDARSHLLEEVQIETGQGPCIESYRSGRSVSVPDIEVSKDEWWQFRGSALAQGFRSMDALPLRLRDTTIGTLNLLRSEPGAAPEDTIRAAQAFADVATIGILHERTLRESAILSEQLQAALNSRIVIEQAKGVISHTRGVSIDDAFALMRQYARSHSMGLSIVAARIVDRSLRL